MIAAGAQHRDGGKPVGIAGIGGEQQRGGARLLHAPLHRRRRFPSPARAPVPAARLGRANGTPPRPPSMRVAGSGANSRRLPSAASTSPRTGVVHPHLLQPARHDVRRGLAGRRIDERPHRLLDEQHLVGGRANRRIVLQHRQDGAACGWPNTRERADTLPDRLVARRVPVRRTHLVKVLVDYVSSMRRRTGISELRDDPAGCQRARGVGHPQAAAILAALQTIACSLGPPTRCCSSKQPMARSSTRRPASRRRRRVGGLRQVRMNNAVRGEVEAALGSLACWHRMRPRVSRR